MHRVVLPERCMVDLVALHQDIRATDELYHRWTQIMPHTKDTLAHGYTRFRQGWQVIGIGTPFIIVALYAQPLLFIQLWCDFFQTAGIQVIRGIF